MRRVLLTLGWLASLVLAFAAGMIALALYQDSTSTPTPAPAPTDSVAQPAPTATAAPTLTLAATATVALPTPTALVPDPLVTTPALTATAPLTDSLELLEAINQARLAADCRVALTWEPRLAQAAQAHADDLGQRGEIDHIGVDGATYSERLERVGYAFNRRGENIAAGYVAPLDVLNQWLDEPDDGPHRLNLLNCAYQHAGVGRSVHPNGYPIWVLDLAEPRTP